jgi:hypothetical protein
MQDQVRQAMFNPPAGIRICDERAFGGPDGILPYPS